MLDSASRHSLDSLRDVFQRRPIREVLRYLPGHVDTIRDTLDTTVIESVLVPAPTIRETADSLATCRHDRDSVTRSVTLWQARELAQREARLLCEAKPVPEQPSRIAWASAGAGAAIAPRRFGDSQCRDLVAW